MRARRTRSSSTTSCAGFTTARSFTSSIRAARRARAGPMAGSASTSAPTSRWPTPSVARSSPAGLENREFIDARDQRVRRVPGERRIRTRSSTRERTTRRPGGADSRARARLCGAPRARTLLDARHHRAPQRRRQRARADQPRAALRPRRPLRLGLNPLRGQNNVQGGGDMGAIPNKFPGGQDVEDATSIAKFERAWNVALPRTRGWHLTRDVRGDRPRRARHALRHR